MTKTVNTILTTAIILSMVILLFYGYCAIQKLDNTKEDQVSSTISQHINYKDRPFNNQLTADNEEDLTEDEDFEEYIEEEEDADAYIEPVEETETPAESISTPRPEARFFVIAGSFKSKANAENKVKKYINMGMQAEIVQLKNSVLHAICIARTATEIEANDTMSALIEKHNIKAYVYKIP